MLTTANSSLKCKSMHKTPSKKTYVKFDSNCQNLKREYKNGEVNFQRILKILIIEFPFSLLE